EFTLSLLKEFKQLGLHTTVDTSGYVSPVVLEKSISNTDLFLYDLKTLNDDLHENLTGVSNKKILQNFELLTQKKANIWVRIPLIPGLNDDVKNITEMVEYLKSKNGVIQRVNILPFHRTGFHKFESLGIENPLPGAKEMDESEITDVKALFTDAGFDVRVGG
ncbi:MAG: radical SAM protein, partial [Bacteroidales bacterium]|nr:radical SAM protein [Bacteroidales bacterium]